MSEGGEGGREGREVIEHSHVICILYVLLYIHLQLSNESECHSTFMTNSTNDLSSSSVEDAKSRSFLNVKTNNVLLTGTI